MQWEHTTAELIDNTWKQTESEARREPQQGLGKHYRGAPLGSKFLNIFFTSKWCIRVYFIFLSDDGTPKHPCPTSTFWRACEKLTNKQRNVGLAQHLLISRISAKL